MTGVVATAETTLCRIFAEVLGLDLVRPQDGFFEVGGDSVLALQVVARARDAGLALSVRDLFDHQTPGTLAAVTGDLQGATGESGTAAPAESPLLTFADDEFDEFEDTETGQQAGGTDGGWETVA
jgi:aryl carrier-like protein